ncbi:MAG TPA: DinB family protein [Acidimicrobiales bacterium]
MANISVSDSSGSSSDEADALLKSLDSQREHVIGILDGLSGEALRQPVLPSGWNCLGLVQHLTLDVEDLWFRQVVAGETDDPGSEEHFQSSWQVAPQVRLEAVFDRCRQAIKRSNQVIVNTALEAELGAWPDFFGEWRLPNLRAVVLHVITETACHAGHLDADREMLDGRKWLTLPS